MSPQFQKLIEQAMEGLPEEAIWEILDFIYFMRKKFLHPEDFRQEIKSLLLEKDLKEMSKKECAHLEEEFEDYQSPIPKMLDD